MKNEKDYFKSYVIVNSEGYEWGDPIFFTDPDHEVKDFYADSSVPNFHKPRWDFDLKEWVEGATDEEIEEITKPRPREPTEVELLEQQVEMQVMLIDELMFGIIPELMGGEE